MRKVLQFTGFHSNVGKTFAGYASSVLKVLKKAIAQKIHWKTFAFCRKSTRTKKLFSRLTFCCLRYVIHCFRGEASQMLVDKPSEQVKLQNRIITPPSESMYLMADLRHMDG